MGHWEFDIATGMFIFNDQYYSLHGTTAQEVGGYQISIQRFAQEFVYPEDAATVGATIQKALESADPNFELQTEARILRNGEPRWVTVWFRTEKDAQGRTIKLHGVNQDITERKQAEEVVQESRARFQGLVETLSDWIWEVDQNGSYTYVSPKVKDLLGYEPEEVLGKTPFDLMPPEEAQRVAGVFGPLLTSQEPLVALENTNLHKDGRLVVFETSGVPFFDTQGQFKGYRGTDRDITERKRLEQQEQTAFERRGRQVRLSTQVSQSVATATSLEDLYQRVVIQIKEQFGYYHTQLLRYDPAQEAVVLVTGYGEVGAKMLAAGHRLPMGEGLIGTAASSGQTVLRPTLENDPDWHPNPLLLETKGEIAVPIKLGDNILGVLDVQSNVAGTLGTDDQLLLEGLCGQIATAIESTRLSQEMAERLQEINRLYRAMSHEGWQAFRETADIPSSFIFDQGGLRPAKDTRLAEELFANIPLTVPGGEVIGTLAIADDPQRPISPEDETFLQQVSEQVALALESARLFEQTQEALHEVARRASELETVARVSATTSTVLDPDKLLQSVVDLTKERFGLYHAHIYLADEAWQTLLLAVGAGDVGQKMAAEGHAIAMDTENSLVARAARERQAVIVNDVRSDPDFLPNPWLAETQSEMAVPMIVGDNVLGVFDVQSDKQNNFTQEDANIYTTLAAQVAVALQNARLYKEQTATVAQLRELDRLKSSFLANMSHELRTPLNSILGFASVMLEEIDGPLNDNMNNDLTLIQKNGQHLLHLINDVLDMAKIEAGRMNLDVEKFNLHEIIEEVINITTLNTSEKDIALCIESDSDRQVEITADRTRLRQVMINLINNALKFTEKGTVSVHALRENDHVLISVKDTGIGIPPSHLESVFQEFTQVDTTATRKVGGTGLGLPISKRLIEMHGGRLWAESTGVSGQGSTFYVFLPLVAQINEPELQAAK
jgi:PAS domain S-box-containing protein